MCNCTGTLYEGKICDRGLIQISTTSATSSFPAYFEVILTIRARPDRNINVMVTTVDLSASSGGVPIFFFSENSFKLEESITFTPTMNENVISVHHGDGLFLLVFSVSGNNSEVFNVPDPISVIKPVKQSLPFNQLNVNLTCSNETSTNLFSCGIINDVFLVSSCEWNENQNKTLGIVYSKLNDIAFPISVLGLDATNGIEQSKSTLENRDDFPRCTCSLDKPLEPTSTHVMELASQQVLSTAFVDEIQSKLLPNWIKLNVTEDSSALDKIAESDFKVNVVPEYSVSNQIGCESVIVETTGQFAILQHDGPLNLKLKTSLNFESINLSPPSRGSVYCVAVNLCNGKDSPVHFGLPLSSQPTINGISFFEKYINKGWNINLKSVIVRNTSKDIIVSTTFWNGITSEYNPWPLSFEYDVLGNMEVTDGSFQLYQTVVGFTFAGHVSYEYIVDGSQVYVD